MTDWDDAYFAAMLRQHAYEHQQRWAQPWWRRWFPR